MTILLALALGDGIAWMDSLERAQARARETGRPLLVYEFSTS